MAWLKGTPTAPVATADPEGEIVQATGIGSVAQPCPDVPVSLGSRPPAPHRERPPLPIDPAYQWPEGILPGDSLPDFQDRATVEDRGLALWVPLDYLDDYPLGSGYWTLTTATDHRKALRTGNFYGRRLGGRDLHAVEVGARAGELLGLPFPHLTAVSYEVVRVDADARWSARFPAYVVH